MTREVKVPLSTDGSLDVRLSTLYQICPELFAVEITPLSDSVVTLPPRLGATQESPSSKRDPVFSKPKLPAAPSPEVENAFWSPVTSGASPATSSQLAEPSPEKQVGNVPSATAVAWPEVAAAKDNPFSAAPVQPTKQAHVPEAAVDATSSKIAGGFDAPPSPKVEDGFHPGAGGFGPAGSSVCFGFPEAAKVNDEGGGVEERARKNPFESGEEFSTLFSKHAEADAAIPYPDKPAFSGGISGGKTPEPEGVWGVMFSGGGFREEGADVLTSATEPFDSIGNLLKQGKTQSSAAIEEPVSAPGDSAGNNLADAAKSAPIPPANVVPDASIAFASGFTAFAPASADQRKPDLFAPTPSFDPFVGFAPGATTPPALPTSMNPAPIDFAPIQTTPPTAQVEPLSEIDPFTMASGFAAPMPEPVTEMPMHVPQESADAEPSAPIPSVPSGLPTNESVVALPTVTQEAPASLPPIPAVAEVSVREVTEEPNPSSPLAPVAGAGSAPAAGDELRDLELRAIFSMSEPFDLAMVARKIVGLPGINSCSLTTPGKLTQASRRDENRLGVEAREIVATLRSLAKLTGLTEARTFTLQTDRGIISLFLEGDCCVTVLHDAATFHPGVREKLILIARNIVKLRE